MVFKIQLAVPFRHIRSGCNLFVYPVKKYPLRFLHQPWNPRHAVFQTFCLFQHLSGRTTTAVPESKQHQCIFCQVTVLETLERPQCHIWIHNTGVCGGISGVGKGNIQSKGLIKVTGRRHENKDITAIDSLPDKGIIWKLVKLIPCDLSRQEIWYTTFFQDLRDGCRISEYIRQPEASARNAKFFHEELFALHHLSDQRFSCREVAVRLQPHGSVCLPSSFPDFFFDLLI